MRTTLDIADDVLFAAKEIARREKKPLGQIISTLARRAFALQQGGSVPSEKPPASRPKDSGRLTAYGIHPLPGRGGTVTNEMIDSLRGASDI